MKRRILTEKEWELIEAIRIFNEYLYESSNVKNSNNETTAFGYSFRYILG